MTLLAITAEGVTLSGFRLSIRTYVIKIVSAISYKPLVRISPKSQLRCKAKQRSLVEGAGRSLYASMYSWDRDELIRFRGQRSRSQRNFPAKAYTDRRFTVEDHLVHRINDK